MVKLGEQISSTSDERLTRTRRLELQGIEAQRVSGQRQQISSAQQKLSQAQTIQEYENIYQGLTPFQQTAFKSPSSIRESDLQTRNTTVSKIDARIEQARLKQNEQQKILNRARTDSESRSADAKIQYYAGLIKGLREGKSKVQSGQNITYDKILDYAEQIADSKEQQRLSSRTEKRLAEEREKEARRKFQEEQGQSVAQGYDFTGTVTQYQGGQVVGYKQFEGGREVGEVSLQGNRAVISPLSTSDFKTEAQATGVEKIRNLQEGESKAGQQRKVVEFSQDIQEAVRLGEQRKASTIEKSDVEEEQKSFIDKLLGTGEGLLDTGKSFFVGTGGLISDIYASIIPTPTIRGNKATTTPAPVVLEEQNKVKSAFLDAIIPPSVKLELGNKPYLESGDIPNYTQLFKPSEKTFEARRKFREGTDEAKTINKEAEVLKPKVDEQILQIETAQTELSNLNTEVNSLNERLQNPNLTEGQRRSLQEKYNKLDSKRLDIISELSEKGIITQTNFSPEGSATLTFTSPELERANEISQIDFASPEVKQLRVLKPKDRYVQEIGIVSAEFITATALGYGLGATGILTKTGTFLTKGAKIIQPIVKASPLFPLATKGGLIATVGGALVLKTGVQGFQSGVSFEQGGLPFTEGAIFGVSRDVGKLAGFGLGGYVGSQVYAEGIVNKLRRGGFTENARVRDFFTKKEISKMRAKVIKQGGTPSDLRSFDRSLNVKVNTARQGVLSYNLRGKEIYRITQAGGTVERIPDTDIKIFRFSTSQEVASKSGKFGQAGYGDNTGVNILSKIRGAGAYSGNIQSRAFFIREGDLTRVAVATPTAKGVMVQEFQTKSILNKLTKVGQAGNIERLNLDFSTLTAKITKEGFYPSKTPTALLRNINEYVVLGRPTDKLFTSLPQQPFSLGRTYQTVLRSPSAFYTEGQSNIGRISSLKRLLSSGQFVFQSPVRTTPQLYATTSPLTAIQSPVQFIPATSVSLGSLSSGVPVTSIGTLQSDIIGGTLSGEIARQIGTRSVIGALGISSVPRLNSNIRTLQNTQLTQRITQLQESNIRQIIRQEQEPRQQQRQQQRQQTLQEQIRQLEPPQSTVNIIETPVTTSGEISIPVLLNLQRLERQQQQRRKAVSKGRQEFYLLPDFTSRVLRLPPLELTEAQAEKQVRKILTGLEIRRGARILG